MPNLRRLTLYHCDWSELPNDELFTSAPNLEWLIISYLSPKMTHLNLRNLDKLTRLEIGLFENSDFLQMLPPNLNILKVSFQCCNDLKQLKHFGHQNLEVLDFSYDSPKYKYCEFDCEMLYRLPNLKHLRVRYIDRIFTNYTLLDNLESFSLDLFSIQRIDLSTMINLTYLELGGADYFEIRSDARSGMIQSIRSSLSSLILLEELHLTPLALNESDIKGFFKNLKKLRVLDLSQNWIRVFEAQTFNGLGNLRQLDLSHNLLQNLEAHVFVELFPSLDTLVLGSESVKSQDEFSSLFDVHYKKIHFVSVDD